MKVFDGLHPDGNDVELSLRDRLISDQGPMSQTRQAI
jgi:hypothetical protein